MKTITGQTEIKQYLTGRKKVTGVVITDDLRIIVVYNDGFYADHIIVYDYHAIKYAGDIYHSKTTYKYIERAIRWLCKHYPEYTKEETERFRNMSV